MWYLGLTLHVGQAAFSAMAEVVKVISTHLSHRYRVCISPRFFERKFFPLEVRYILSFFPLNCGKTLIFKEKMNNFLEKSIKNSNFLNFSLRSSKFICNS